MSRRRRPVAIWSAALARSSRAAPRRSSCTGSPALEEAVRLEDLGLAALHVDLCVEVGDAEQHLRAYDRWRRLPRRAPARTDSSRLPGGRGSTRPLRAGSAPRRARAVGPAVERPFEDRVGVAQVGQVEERRLRGADRPRGRARRVGRQEARALVERDRVERGAARRARSAACSSAAAASSFVPVAAAPRCRARASSESAAAASCVCVRRNVGASSAARTASASNG